MSTAPRRIEAPGPFRASHLRDGDPYELSNGHSIRCMSAGGRHASSNQLGAQLLGTDPAVEEVGVDAAYRVFPDDRTLRAPDVSIGNVPDRPGWIDGVPGLALEYADTGQDDKDLRDKIGDLLAGGTRYVWVVHLTGPQRLEVHEAGKPVQVLSADATVSAPGVLRNSYPVRSFFDRAAAERLTFRNLLQREGYDSLDAVRSDEARAALLKLVEAFAVALSPTDRAAIDAADLGTLRRLFDSLLATRRLPLP